MVYTFLYKCRLCGKTVREQSGGQSSVIIGIERCLSGSTERMAVGLPIRIMDYHVCYDGSYGVTDLQGAKIDD